MAKRDYYEVLGLEKNAGKPEIKKAYRKMARKYHPDMNKDNTKESEERFKEVSEAYEILVDEQKRANYDRFGHEGVKGSWGGGGFDWSNFTHFGDVEDIFGSAFSDIFSSRGGIFEMFFGGGDNGMHRVRRGKDISYQMEISLKEAAFGVEKDIEFYRKETCGNCKGTGGEPGSKVKTCPSCNGTGQVRHIQSTGFSQIVRIENCRKCRDGKVVENKCDECDGTGKKRRRKTISVQVPSGLDSGSTIRIRGEGEAGERSGLQGDLYIKIIVEPNDFFKRHGDEIICEIPITFTQAALGDEIDVPTIDGRDKLKIPDGTQTDAVFRLKGKGIQNYRTGRRGDQHIKIVVVTPKKLKDKEKDLLIEFSKLRGEKIPEKKKLFLKRKRSKT